MDGFCVFLFWQVRSYQNHTAGFPAVEAGMATSPKYVKYYVQVARLRLDTTNSQAMTAMQSKKRSNGRGCCPVPNGNCSPSIMPLISLTRRL